MTRQKRRSRKIDLGTDSLVGLARSVFPAYAQLLIGSCRLTAGSGAWRRADGSLTCRLVYRSDDGFSVAVAFRVAAGSTAAESIRWLQP